MYDRKSQIPIGSWVDMRGGHVRLDIGRLYCFVRLFSNRDISFSFAMRAGIGILYP